MHALYTIAFSHYCERARWALQRAGIAFVEHRSLPILHMGPVAFAVRLRKGPGGGASTGLSTPLLRLDDGRLLRDSRDIVAYAAETAPTLAVPLAADFGDDVAALELRFARELGRDSRLLAYHHLLADAALLREVIAHNGSPAQRAIWTLGGPLLPGTIRRGLRIRPDRAERARQRIDALWDDVDAALVDGRPWLGGAQFSSADLTFAALAAPVLGISDGDGYGAWLPPRERLPPTLRAEVERWRSRPAGQLATRAYAEQRQPVALAAQP